MLSLSPRFNSEHFAGLVSFPLSQLCLQPPLPPEHFIFIYLFIYLFMAASGLSCGAGDLSLWYTGFSLVVACGLSSCGTWAICGTRVPERMGSVVVARGLGCPAACGILVPRPGIESASPALQGGFLTTRPREVPPPPRSILKQILYLISLIIAHTLKDRVSCSALCP